MKDFERYPIMMTFSGDFVKVKDIYFAPDYIVRMIHGNGPSILDEKDFDYGLPKGWKIVIK
jgi:hypothetical protein